MRDFSNYYFELIRQFFENCWEFIKSVFSAIGKFFGEDVVNYFKLLADCVGDFNPFEWICLIVVSVINVSFFVFLVLRLSQIIRRYIIFRKKEVDKQDLLEEISGLNQKVAELVDEKNKILALRVAGMAGVNPQLPDVNTKDKKKKQATGESRFVKLIDVDIAYDERLTTIAMRPEDLIGLPQIVSRFIDFAASQMRLYYNKQTVSQYLAGMAASKVLILEGISGTGKTSLPYAMSRFLKNNANIISVQPSWRDRAELLGYLNEFTKRFNETDFLKALYECTYREDINFIVLDEMNLARIEYYFAEFLSVMEMPNIAEWKIDLVPDVKPNDPKHLIQGKILVPQNVWFIGTANKDDSTFTITDKVYDRAITLELNSKTDYFDAEFTDSMELSYDYLDTLFQTAIKDNPISIKHLDNLVKVDKFIQEKFKIGFGNRIMKHIKLFVPVYVACGRSEVEGIDFMLRSKILRKFESLNIMFLKNEIDELIALLDKLFGKNSFAISIAYLRELQKMS